MTEKKKKPIRIEGYESTPISQAGTYAMLKSMGKEPNPGELKIKILPPIDGKKAWIFPDGSKMMYISDGTYQEVEELK